MLTVAEQIELSQLEERIDRGLKAFHEAGQALAAIRANKLYRTTHSTFEDYCHDRWQLRQSRAYQLMDAADVMNNLQSSTIVEVLPCNEAQVRPLTALSPEQQVTAANAATTIADGSPTAKEYGRAATAAKAKHPAFAPGQTAIVLDENSEFYGQQVEVVSQDGIIVQANVGGDCKPFLCNELTEQPATAEATTQKTKPDPIAALQARAEIAELRVELLEVLIQKLVTAARSGSVGAALLDEAEGAIG